MHTHRKSFILQYPKFLNYLFSSHHHYLALQPYASLGLLCDSPPLVSILSFPSPSYYLLRTNIFLATLYSSLLYDGCRISTPEAERPRSGVDNPTASSAEVRNNRAIPLLPSEPSRPLPGWNLPYLTLSTSIILAR